MKQLSRIEEVLMITILKLKADAYGVSIRERIRRDLNERWSFGSIYPALDKLCRLGYLRKFKGDPSPERGGKSKFFYRISPSGLRALTELRDTQQRLWADLPSLVLEDR